LGLWIDLTNTDRFYSKEQIEECGTRYVKIHCRGHGEAPSKDQVKTFIRICDQFMEGNPDDVIGVHCTHGFNRSGYLICSFLTEVWDWDVRAALSHFAGKRSPGIYKQDYINQLCEQFGAPDDGAVPTAPALPEWCFEDEDETDDDGFSTGNNSNGGPSSSSSGGMLGKHPRNNESQDQPRFKRKRELYKENPTFMEGVGGVEPVTDREELSTIQRKVQDMVGWRG
jgi:mRNA-capping enzyme